VKQKRVFTQKWHLDKLMFAVRHEWICEWDGMEEDENYFNVCLYSINIEKKLKNVCSQLVIFFFSSLSVFIYVNIVIEIISFPQWKAQICAQIDVWVFKSIITALWLFITKWHERHGNDDNFTLSLSLFERKYIKFSLSLSLSQSYFVSKKKILN
jgi:hypothetical protein